MIRNIIYSAIVILAGALMLTACDKEDTDEVITYPSMDEFLKSKNNMTIFLAALDKAQLQSFKDGPGPFTWIAPTDAAFQASGITMDSLNKMTPGKVNYLIQYHLINAKVVTRDMIAQNSFARATQLGSASSIYLGQMSDSFYVNGGTIVSPDNLIANGVIHIVNRYNTPPNLKGNLQSVLTNAGQHSLFIAALTRANRWATLSTSSVFTVVAPTDAAMTAAGYTNASITAATVGSMDSLVRYHMFSGTRLFKNDFANRVTPGTFLSAVKTLTASGNGTKLKGLSNPSPFDIVGPDNLAINGVVHSINGVLKY